MLREGLCAQRELQISQMNASLLADTLHEEVRNPPINFLLMQGPDNTALEQIVHLCDLF